MKGDKRLFATMLQDSDSLSNAIGMGFLGCIVVALLVLTTTPYLLFDRPYSAAGFRSGAVNLSERTATLAAGEEASSVSGVNDDDQTEAAAENSNRTAEENSPEPLTPGQPDRIEQVGERNGILPIMQLDYSLSERRGNEVNAVAQPNGAIKINKVVLAGGQRVGDLEITVDKQARLLVEAADVRQTLAGRQGLEAGLARLPASGLVSFRTLRNLGIDLRYAPNEDVIRLNPN